MDYTLTLFITSNLEKHYLGSFTTKLNAKFPPLVPKQRECILVGSNNLKKKNLLLPGQYNFQIKSLFCVLCTVYLVKHEITQHFNSNPYLLFVNIINNSQLSVQNLITSEQLRSQR
jgi:hypothetical protein